MILQQVIMQYDVKCMSFTYQTNLPLQNFHMNMFQNHM